MAANSNSNNVDMGDVGMNDVEMAEAGVPPVIDTSIDRIEGETYDEYLTRQTELLTIAQQHSRAQQRDDAIGQLTERVLDNIINISDQLDGDALLVAAHFANVLLQERPSIIAHEYVSTIEEIINGLAAGDSIDMEELTDALTNVIDTQLVNDNADLRNQLARKQLDLNLANEQLGLLLNREGRDEELAELMATMVDAFKRVEVNLVQPTARDPSESDPIHLVVVVEDAAPVKFLKGTNDEFTISPLVGVLKEVEFEPTSKPGEEEFGSKIVMSKLEDMAVDLLKFHNNFSGSSSRAGHYVKNSKGKYEKVHPSNLNTTLIMVTVLMRNFKQQIGQMRRGLKYEQGGKFDSIHYINEIIEQEKRLAKRLGIPTRALGLNSTSRGGLLGSLCFYWEDNDGKHWELDLSGPVVMFLREGIAPIEWMVRNEMKVEALPYPVKAKTAARAIVAIEDWSLAFMMQQMDIQKVFPSIIVVSSGDPTPTAKENVGILMSKLGLPLM